MVEQSQSLFDDEKIMNGVYERLEEVGYGTFATVYKCRSLSNASLKEGRFISDAHLQMLQVVARDSPEIEFIKTESWDYDAYSNEKKAALAELQQLEKIFPKNSAEYPLEANAGDTRLVAVKKSKVNTFNDRDGILFYALREVQMLQRLKGQKHVCEILDVFY